jgi:hypothetical protein
MKITAHTKIVTIQKWHGNKEHWYWIIDFNGEPIDGFSKKYQAIDAIERWGMVRKDKSVKEIF